MRIWCMCLRNLLVHPAVNPLTGCIDAECKMRDEREEAEGQVVETPTADGARKVEEELFHHRDEDRVPKCKDASVDNLISRLEAEGGGSGISWWVEV